MVALEMNGHSDTAAMESLRNLSVTIESIGNCRKDIISKIRQGAVEDVIKEISDEATRRAHDPSVQADFSHAKGQHKLALMYLVDAVFLNAQMDKNEASLSTDVRQAACRSISSFLPDLVQNLTTPSNCEQVDRLLIGWRARKTDPRFDSEHITEATACMARAKAARQEQLKRRVAARGVPTSDGKVLPLKIGSMFGSFLLRGPAFGDPTLSNPDHSVVDVVRRRLGQTFRPQMRPPAALEFLKFNSPVAGRFELLGDDPETAPGDWADDEELAIRQQLRSRQPPAAVPNAQTVTTPSVSTATAILPQHSQSSHPGHSQPSHPGHSQPSHPGHSQPSHPADPPSDVPKREPTSASVNGLVIPGIPAKPLPDPPLKAGSDAVPHGSAGVRHSAPPSVQSAPQATQPRELGSTGHMRPEHGLPPPQSLPQPAPHVPPSGNFSATPPWRAPHEGTVAHQLPLKPQHTLPMAPAPLVNHAGPPPAAPYADMAVYGDSGEYMPPLPSEPYDGDGSAPPPLPDEPPPLPDEPYEAAFPDCQEGLAPYSMPDNGAAPKLQAAGTLDTPAPGHSPSHYAVNRALLATPSHTLSSAEGHVHPTPAPAAAAAVPPYPQPSAPRPYIQAPAVGTYAAHSPPATPPEPTPPLPVGADTSAPPPMPPAPAALLPLHPGAVAPMHPPAHPPPYGAPVEWGQQASPPGYPQHQHPQQHSTPYPGSEAHYHTPPSSVYNMSPHSTSQEQVSVGFPGGFPGSPDRYPPAGRHEILPPAGPPPQAAMHHPQMSPPPPLQPPPGNPPPVGANPVMHYSGPPAGFPYRGPPGAGHMHGDPNPPHYHGWGPGQGYSRGQVPMGFAPPRGHPPQPQQPPPRQHQAHGGGSYLPPPPPVRGQHGQMNGMAGRGKRPRPW